MRLMESFGWRIYLEKGGGFNDSYREMDKVWRHNFGVKSIPCRRSFGDMGPLDSWSFHPQHRERGQWLC
jgi:hypothetical protein